MRKSEVKNIILGNLWATYLEMDGNRSRPFFIAEVNQAGMPLECLMQEGEFGSNEGGSPPSAVQ